MASVQKFEELEVWQKARKLVKAVYCVTQEGKFVRDFGLRDQIQRAAVSVMSNLAEGFERGGNKEFSYFLFGERFRGRSALSTLCGFRPWLFGSATFEKLNQSALCVSRQLSGFIKYLNRAQKTVPSKFDNLKT